MKIGIDVRWINRSGIGTTIRELLNHLKPERLNSITLFSEKNWVNPYPSRCVSVPYAVYGVPQHFAYPRLIDEAGVSLFHMPHFDAPYFYSGPMVVTIHDLIHLVFPNFSTKPFAKIYAREVMSRALSQARRVIVVSENTKKDLVERFPRAEKKVKVLYPGVHERFRPVNAVEGAAVLGKYNLRPGYALFVGNLRKSKNTESLIRAYTLWKEKQPSAPPLLLVGQNFLPQYDRGEFPAGIRHIKDVSHEDLPAIYSAALFFIFPSYYEGFGLPPLEAMACGAPVIASMSASLPEVCADAALLVDPSSVDEIAAAMDQLASSEFQRLNLRQKGFENVKRFSWSRFAESTWRFYEEALEDS